MSKPGDPGKAGTYNPKTGGKFEPTTTADQPGSPHENHGHKGKTPRKPRPKPKPH